MWIILIIIVVVYLWLMKPIGNIVNSYVHNYRTAFILRVIIGAILLAILYGIATLAGYSFKDIQ